LEQEHAFLLVLDEHGAHRQGRIIHSHRSLFLSAMTIADDRLYAAGHTGRSLEAQPFLLAGSVDGESLEPLTTNVFLSVLAPTDNGVIAGGSLEGAQSMQKLDADGTPQWSHSIWSSGFPRPAAMASGDGVVYLANNVDSVAELDRETELAFDGMLISAVAE